MGLRACSSTVERMDDCLDTQRCIKGSQDCGHSVREIEAL